MTTATKEGTEIIQMWGDRKTFVERVSEYAEKVGASYGFVITLPLEKSA